jgi:hypothetical protein
MARFGMALALPLAGGAVKMVSHSAGVGEIGEPFDLGRHVGQAVELGGGEQPVGGAILAGSWSSIGINLACAMRRPDVEF